MTETNLPSSSDKPSLVEWFEAFLPFQIPRIPLTRTAANLDKALARIVLAAGDNGVARIKAMTNRVDARSSAESTFIKFGESQITDQRANLQDRAIEYAIGDAARHQQNREDVLGVAAEHLNRNPPNADATMPIDDDWLDAFQRYAEQKSTSDIQQLWGRILSSEIRQPGTTSLRTLAFLSTISNQEAVQIANAFRSVIDSNFIPIAAGKNGLLSFGELIALQELSIIAGLSGMGGVSWGKPATATPEHEFPYAVTLSYHNKVGLIYFDNHIGKVDIPSVGLTTVGRELFAITETVLPDYSYFESSLKGLNSAGIQKIYVADFIPSADGYVRFFNMKQLHP